MGCFRCISKVVKVGGNDDFNEDDGDMPKRQRRRRRRRPRQPASGMRIWVDLSHDALILPIKHGNGSVIRRLQRTRYVRFQAGCAELAKGAVQ